MHDYHINIFYRDEDVAYVADIPGLEVCSAFGATADKCLDVKEHQEVDLPIS